MRDPSELLHMTDSRLPRLPLPDFSQLRYPLNLTSLQSLAYGKCIGKSYQDVSKDMCQEEFQAFKQCVQVCYCPCISEGGSAVCSCLIESFRAEMVDLRDSTL